MPGAPAVSRSGTSRTSQLRPNATTITAAAVMKTGWSATETAVAYTAWIAGGRCWMAAGLAVRGRVCAGRETTRKLPAELVREDRTEDGDADRAADLPEQGRA